MRYIASGILVMALLCLAVGSVQAGTDLGLQREHWPEVITSSQQVTYTVADHHLEVTGVPNQVDTDATGTLNLDIYDWDVNFLLTADYNPDTQQFENGYLEITGDFDGTNTRYGDGQIPPEHADPDLPVIRLFYSNTLTAWSACTTDLFQFTFTQEGSNGLPNLPQDGTPIGVILDARDILEFRLRDAEGNLILDSSGNPIPVDPHFDIDFGNGGVGKSETYFFPEPGTLALLTLGALGLVRRRRQRAPSE